MQVALDFFGLYDPSPIYWDIFVLFAVIIGLALGLWLLFRPNASGATRFLGMIIAGGSALYAYISWG